MNGGQRSSSAPVGSTEAGGREHRPCAPARSTGSLFLGVSKSRSEAALVGNEWSAFLSTEKPLAAWGRVCCRAIGPMISDAFKASARPTKPLTIPRKFYPLSTSPVSPPEPPEPPEPPTDPVFKLVRDAIEGNRAAEIRLTRQLLLPMLDAAVSKHLFGNAQRRYDKEDVVQEIFEHLYYQRWARLDPYDPAKGTLSNYVWSVAKHWIRDHGRKLPPPEPVEDPEKDLTPDSGPEGKAQDAQALERVLEILNKREILLFRWVYLEGVERHDVAERLQISIGAAYKLIQRMEKKIKANLSNSDDTAHKPRGRNP